LYRLVLNYHSAEDKEDFAVAMGRPREFDAEKALECALNVFWRKGYEGTSLSDLTEAMGINRPSLYAAFGNKEELFRKALARYLDGPASFHREALQQPKAKAAVERLLYGMVEALTNPCHPSGCLAVQGALSCGDAAQSIRDELVRRRAEAEAELRQRLERAKTEGDLPADANPADLARYISTVTQGMAVQAAGGASRADLQSVAEMALRTWPE
jgi:AcrR family transcriptional regulator